MKIGALSFRVIIPGLLLAVFNGTFEPDASRNDHPALTKHVAEITPGQSLFNPGIDPWPPLLFRILLRAIAPRDVVGIKLSFQGMQYQRRRAGAELYWEWYRHLPI